MHGIAMTYRSLNRDGQAHFDPGIAGFNSTDMYAVDHIKRLLRLFPVYFRAW